MNDTVICLECRWLAPFTCSKHKPDRVRDPAPPQWRTTGLIAPGEYDVTSAVERNGEIAIVLRLADSGREIARLSLPDDPEIEPLPPDAITEEGDPIA